MFKKSLLALALAGTASFAANAVTTLTGSVDLELSAQGAASSATIDQASLSSATLIYTLDATAAAALTAGDDLVITIAGATLGLGTDVAAAFVDGQNTNDTTVDLTAATSYTGNTTATIAVGTVVAGTEGVEANNLINITGLVFDGTTANASGEVTGTVHLVDSAGSIVYGSVTETIFTLEDQFTFAVTTPLNAAIQVSANRTEFAANATDDTIVLAVSEVGASTNVDLTYLEAQPTSVTYTLTADRGFSYLDTDSDGTKDLAIVGSSAAVDGQDTFVTTYSADDMTATVVQTVVDTTSTTAGLDTAVTFTVDGGDGDTIINRDTFALGDATFAYTDDESTAATVAVNTTDDAGEWTIAGGSVISISALPFGEGISQAINVANTSGTAGVAELVAFVDGVSSTHSLTTAIAANAVTKLATEIKALAVTEGWDSSSVSFEIVVTVPAANITANAFFYVSGDSDRTRVPTSDL